MDNQPTQETLSQALKRARTDDVPTPEEFRNAMRYSRRQLQTKIGARAHAAVSHTRETVSNVTERGRRFGRRHRQAIPLVVMGLTVGIPTAGHPGEERSEQVIAADVAAQHIERLTALPMEDKFTKTYAGRMTVSVPERTGGFGVLGLVSSFGNTREKVFEETCLVGKKYDIVKRQIAGGGTTTPAEYKETSATSFEIIPKSSTGPSLHFHVENGQLVPDEETEHILTNLNCPHS